MRSFIAIGYVRILLLVSLAALAVCGGGKSPGDQAGSSTSGALSALFPSADLPAGVVAVGEPRFYHGRELYDLIDSGADLYNEFGFIETAVREYSVAGGETVSANIHRMTNPKAAFGIFSVTRKLIHRPASMGTIGARGDSRVLFCAGKYFVDVKAAGRDSSVVEAIDEIAAKIELELEQQPNEWPEVLSLLPRKGLIPHTETYVVGPLGLNSRRYLSDENPFELGSGNPGAIGSYRMRIESNPAIFLMVQYPDSAAAARVFDSVSEFYRGKARSAPSDSAKVNLTGQRIVYTDPERMDVVILRTTQISVLFDSPGGAMHGTGVENPHSAVKPIKPGMSSPHGGGMTTSSGSKNTKN